MQHIRLNEDVSDSYRASMSIKERKVDPRFHTTPLGLLRLEMESEWIREQQKLFDENCKENTND